MKELSVKRMILFLILLGSAVGCLLLGLKVRQVTCDNVYVLSFTQEHKNFLSSDISFVEDNDISFTYTKYLYPEISNGFRTEKATVIATNDNYSYFSRMQIRSGAFFNSVHEDRKMAVAVLNEAAAYQMFGNYDCVGENIYLNQNAFVVIGIVKECGDEDDLRIYVPEKTTEDMEIAGSEVNQLWCRFANMAETSMAISKMGYSMDEIDITQMDLYKGVFMQRFFILLILAGIIPFVCILREAFAKTKELREDAGGNRSWIIKWIFQIAICVGGSILILKIIQLAWFIPPNYDVVGKSWLNIFYEIIEFYTLSGIKMDNMQFLNRWNLVSLFCFAICIMGIMLCRIVTVKGQRAICLQVLKGDDTD